MNKLEKAERIMEYAHVSYEDALAALDASGEDMLDAAVLLEKQGKTEKPGQSIYTTNYQGQKEYIDVPSQVAQQKQAAPSFRRSLVNAFRTVIRFVKCTSLIASHHERELFRIPSWVVMLALLFAWKYILPVAAIALLFGVRYAFEGNEDAEAANSILTKAGDIVDNVRNELNGTDKKKGDDT